MRLALGIVVLGVLVGSAIGAAYWNSRPVQEANREPPQRENYYLCQWDDPGSGESAMIIRGDSARAKQIIFPWRNNSGDLFLIGQTTDLHYIATDTEAKRREVDDSSLNLDRVTGDLYVTARFSPAAIQLLASICQRHASREECVAGMKQLGGSESDCELYESACQKWVSGNNLRITAHYLCRTSESRF
jgi:hypothetical protein